MDWLYFVAIALLVVIFCVAVTIWSSDCDLVLLWYLKYGKSPESLAGKVVWITGASSGIGEALAYELARAGCKLVLSARREERLQETKAKCLAEGQTRKEDILVLPLDLLDLPSHQTAVETVIKYFKQIDVLVNNAGRSQRSLIAKTPVEVDKQLFDVDFFAPVSLTKTVLPYMTAQKHGHFLVTSSVAGKLAAPGSGTYSAAKHAINGFFDCLRIEGHLSNISVTIACPGPVYSEALLHAFTDSADKKLGVAMDKSGKRMSAERCAKLMAVATANRLYEVWISPNPELFYCYLFQYLPSIAKRVAVKLGQARARKVLEMKENLRE